eukprot:Skav204965  [mRNA]  locus=scaffold6694:4196:4693:- [translate_table: standard]
MLLNAKADPNLQTRGMEWTPLLQAARTPWLFTMDALVSCLLHRKAHVNATDDEWWPPLHYASYHGHSRMVRSLIDNFADVNAQTKHAQLPIRLGEHSVIWYGQETPLMCAAARDHLNVVLVLLEENADVTLKDSNSRTWIDMCEGDCYELAVGVLRTFVDEDEHV